MQRLRGRHQLGGDMKPRGAEIKVVLFTLLFAVCQGLVAPPRSSLQFRAREGAASLRVRSSAELRAASPPPCSSSPSSLSRYSCVRSSICEWIKGGEGLVKRHALTLAKLSSFAFNQLGAPGKCLVGVAAASICRFAMCKMQEASKRAERQRYLSMPSVVTWNQPRIFQQGGDRTRILEAVLRDGTSIAGIGLNETEFRLLFDVLRGRQGAVGRASNAANAEAAASHSDATVANVGVGDDADVGEVEVTERHVDLSVTQVKVEMSGMWEQGRLALKNKSLRGVLDPSPSMRKELASNMRRRRDLDENEEMRGEKLIEWLRGEYGNEQSRHVAYDASRNMTLTSQSLLPLLNWFRERYPYYRQRCMTCSSDETVELGTMRACGEEGGASRVEYFFCPSCEKHTKFVRYNGLAKIIEDGRGRCGEYAALWYAVMQALGYESRWVVDWTDHVWVEINVGGEWAHMDPCEAAFHDKKMYAGWGKKHTYIVAFDRNGVQVRTRFKLNLANCFPLIALSPSP